MLHPLCLLTLDGDVLSTSWRHPDTRAWSPCMTAGRQKLHRLLSGSSDTSADILPRYISRYTAKLDTDAHDTVGGGAGQHAEEGVKTGRQADPDYKRPQPQQQQQPSSPSATTAGFAGEPCDFQDEWTCPGCAGRQSMMQCLRYEHRQCSKKRFARDRDSPCMPLCRLCMQFHTMAPFPGLGFQDP